MLSLFFALFFQDYARPYESLTADHVEFGSLLISHFILLLGILFHAVQLEQLAWNEGTCLEVITDISNAENLSSIENEYDDVALKCAQAQLSFIAANSTYKAIEVILKWFPVLFLCIALWATYTDLNRVLQEWLRKGDEEDLEDDPKLKELNKLCASVLSPAVLHGAKDFLRESTPTEREYFKHLLMLLDENYQDWLDRQAKTFGEFVKTTAERLRENLTQLYKILVAFMQIIFCLRQKKRTHVESDPRAAGGAETGGSSAAAAAMPKKGAKKAAIIAKIVGVVVKKLGGKKDEDAKPPKPKRAERDPHASNKAADMDAGDDVVEAYIKFAKSKSDKEKEESERLALPELRPATMGLTRTYN